MTIPSSGRSYANSGQKSLGEVHGGSRSMIRLLRRSVFLAAAAILCLSSESSSASTGKYAGEFIAIGVGGRALGLGSSYAALANDVTAGYWNPAGLSSLSYPQIALMHDERFGSLVNYDYAAVALPVGMTSTLGLSVIRLGVDNVANTKDAWVDQNNDGLPDQNEIDYSKIRYFNTADWAFYFSYARRLTHDLSYGLNLKFIRRQNGGQTATGIGFDAGVQYVIDERVALGANFQDLTTTLIAWNNGRNELISPTLKLGAAYFIDALGGRFSPTVDVDTRFEGRKSASNAHIGRVSFDFHGGLEFDFQRAIAVRAGISDIGSPNFGTGIHLSKLDIDYCFSKFDAVGQLDDTHRISLTFTLQAEQFARGGE